LIKKKLIEVALPLEAINQESAREKSIRHGHPSTLHLWWARRPLATCRAVLFASLVDDPSSHPDKFPTEEAQEKERQRLHDLIGRIVILEEKGKTKQVVQGLVSWDDIEDTKVIEAAQREIARSIAWNRGEEPPTKAEEVQEYLRQYAPPVYDPFCGGGSIPLEAQRLGLEAHGSDLNPVAVLITKALIEIPPKFKDMSPVNPEAQKKLKTSRWYGAQGLAEDVRYYGQWMRDEAEKRIGRLYPKVKLPQEYGGGEATAIAWLWARTVKCPNPACGIHTPLLSSFVLSSKKGKENYLIPQIFDKHVEFTISDKPPKEYPNPKKGLKRGMSGVFECVACKTVTTRDYVSQEAKAKRLEVVQTTVVVEWQRGRLYLPAKFSPYPENIPKADITGLDAELSPNPRDVWCRNFGLDTPADLFTPRQLAALTTFSDLVSKIQQEVWNDAVANGIPDDGLPLREGGTGAIAYAEAVATYLAFLISKITESSSTLCTWSSSPKNELVVSTFRRQALPMTWDFAEANPFGFSSGSVVNIIQFVAKALAEFPAIMKGDVRQADAKTEINSVKKLLISTDPPYYDNIGYADLSDFFYVWLRRSVGRIYPNIFSTLLVPKAQELVAIPYRFGGDKKKAQKFFEEGLSKAFSKMREAAHSEYPLTVYYAFKQSETDNDEEDRNNIAVVASTGWETMLEGLIQAGFTITNTLPMRTERSARSVSIGTNALASSIVLVCRPRPESAPSTTRRQFLTTLKRELPEALKTLQQGNIAPVDLAQASIGPGMAVFSRYAKVLEADGTPMRVRTALQLINQTLDEFLTEQEGEFDADTRWALTWFEQHQFEEGKYGDAETLSKAKNPSVTGLVNSGILKAKGGKVQLLRRDELPDNWTPEPDERTPDWEVTQHLIWTLDQKGESGASVLLSKLGDRGEVARDLAYRLYSICDRKSWTQEAIAYNSLVIFRG
jgi:putative DNA methylase